jgi:SAM-dependent methyltransferase
VEHEGSTWQVDVWNQMSQRYGREVDRRFAPVVEGVINRASLQPGERVLDLGTGTGAAALRAAVLVGLTGTVVGIDISDGMLRNAVAMAATLGLENVEFRDGGAELIPADDGSFDVVVASLSLMYVTDRTTAAREIARVLRPRGRFVAAAWAGPQACDIVLFQQAAGRYAPAPPVPDVGPGAMADVSPFLAQLAGAGIDARAEAEVLGFDFDDFDSAWSVLASVTAAQLAPERREEAMSAVRRLMWPHGDGPRHFRNTTQFMIGSRRQDG